jgi:serine/threonine-protein kinase
VEPPAVVATVPAAAAPSAAPKVEVAAARPQVASFTIESVPAGQVKVNGKFVSASPAVVRNVQPGEVDVEVYDSRLGFSKRQTLYVEAGDNGVKRIVVAQGTVEFRVRPYATVIVDGTKSLGQTPFGPVQLYEGRHTVKLVNRDLGKEVDLELVVKPGTNIVKHSFLE